RQARQRVQRLAVDILYQQVKLARAEEPVTNRFQSVDFDQIGVVDHLGHAVFVLGLLQVLLILGTVERNDLERVLLAVGLAADVQDRAVGAGAKGAQDLKFADGAETLGHTFPRQSPSRGFAQKKVSGTFRRSKLQHLLGLESSTHLFLGKAASRS